MKRHALRLHLAPLCGPVGALHLAALQGGSSGGVLLHEEPRRIGSKVGQRHSQRGAKIAQLASHALDVLLQLNLATLFLLDRTSQKCGDLAGQVLDLDLLRVLGHAGGGPYGAQVRGHVRLERFAAELGRLGHPVVQESVAFKSTGEGGGVADASLIAC